MDSAGRPSTVKLKFDGRYEEATSAAICKVGYMVKRNSSGAVLHHTTAGQPNAQLCIVSEDMNILQGASPFANYASGDIVSLIYPEPGDEIQVFLADNENVAIGARLMAAGDGTFKAYAASTQAIDGNAGTVTFAPNEALVEAIEALDLSGVNTDPQKINVRVL